MIYNVNMLYNIYNIYNKYNKYKEVCAVKYIFSFALIN